MSDWQQEAREQRLRDVLSGNVGRPPVISDADWQRHQELTHQRHLLEMRQDAVTRYRRDMQLAERRWQQDQHTADMSKAKLKDAQDALKHAEDELNAFAVGVEQ